MSKLVRTTCAHLLQANNGDICIATIGSLAIQVVEHLASAEHDALNFGGRFQLISTVINHTLEHSACKV
jgi:hypothetical protein